MIASRTKSLAKLGIALQCLLVSLAFWSWLLISHGNATFWKLDVARYLVYNTILLTGLVLAYATASNKMWFTQLSSAVCHRHAFRQAAFSTGLLLLVLVGERDQTISRVFLFTFVPLLYVLLLATQRLLPLLLQRLNFGVLPMHRMVLAGSCQGVSSLQGWLARKQQLGYKIMGLVCHDQVTGSFQGFKVLGPIEDLERIIVEQDITHVIVVEFPAFRHFLTHYTEVCERRGVRLRVICDFEKMLRHPVTMFEDEGLRFIGLRAEPLEDPLGRFVKRCLDIAVALPVVVLILPFTTLLVAWMQRRYAPGPIFYRQLRSGLQHIPFAIYKYRTMYVANPDPSRQATQDDSRIYPAGKWLRKCSIDELPQFLNVLRGEMSVVGPRPHLLEHDEQFAQALANYPVRGNVKPGITGLAQVRGYRGETKTPTDIIKRVESDIQYLENWSLLMDCWIILKTATQVVIPPRTAG
jgi:putative colanic acid biosynthesis UDP-glucose lipid carrier transferase